MEKNSGNRIEIIEVLICTIDEGILKVPGVLQQQQSGVCYLVSHQYSGNQGLPPPPQALMRDDVRIIHLKGKGLSKNRNYALKNAVGDVCLIADDDIQYLEGAFEKIRKAFSEDQQLAVACFQVKTPEGEPVYKKYPAGSMRLTKHRHHYISSVEIALRLNPVKGMQIGFDERFGLGSGFFQDAEEIVFVKDCISKGLVVKYFPVQTVLHPWEDSARLESRHSPSRNRVRAGYHARVLGWKAIPIAFFQTIYSLPTLMKQRRNPIVYLYERLSAILLVFRTNHLYSKH